MLLSPGHSPRHVASPSPTPNPEATPRSGASSAGALTTYTPPSRKRQAVLDEDTYVAAIEKIIERDYFPDIAKLQDRLDWLEAVKTGDPIQIRDAQLKIVERRRGRKVISTPNSVSRARVRTVTPGTGFTGLNTPFDDFERGEALGEGRDDGAAGIDESLGLDEFFRRYTSEDNESFSKILDKDNRKRKERNVHYLLEGERELIGDAKRDRITDGYGTSDQPVSTLDGWKFRADNLLMYHPVKEAPLTDEDRELRLKALTKEITKGNTRFHGKMSDTRPVEDGGVEVLYGPLAGATPVPFDRDGEKGKKYDLEDLKRTPNLFYVESQKKADNGYSFVKTPSPAPGADESPFITWGEIEGTPLRLESEDAPFGIGSSSDGPHFQMPNPPVRDVKAHSLSREAAKKLRERSRMFQKPPLPSPSRGGSASPNVRTLSSAAQKFVRNTIFKSSSLVDETLRASYRGASPGRLTPKSGRSLSRLGRDGSIGSRSPSMVYLEFIQIMFMAVLSCKNEDEYYQNSDSKI
uniref:DGCR-like protein n=1 Tax=Hypericum perforatum TaxID=65561 RepID=D9ZHC6_HYPPE|nr:DGCR-like protein [Hypericum perforatum]